METGTLQSLGPTGAVTSSQATGVLCLAGALLLSPGTRAPASLPEHFQSRTTFFLDTTTSLDISPWLATRTTCSDLHSVMIPAT